MNAAARTALLLCAGFGLPAHGQIATITCQSGNGSTVTQPVYAFGLEYLLPATPIFSMAVAVSPAAFPTLLAAAAHGTTYSSCTLSNGAGALTLTPATITSADAFGVGAGLLTAEGVSASVPTAYTETGITSTSISIAGTQGPASALQVTEAIARMKAPQPSK